MNESLATCFERLAGQEPARRLLSRIGLHPRQFVLFLGLFRTLSDNAESMSIIGADRASVAFLSLYAAATLLAGCFLLVLFHPSFPTPVYLLGNLWLTFFAIFFTMLREAPNVLFNPVEASVIAHVPVHGPTYASAKIAHMLITVLYLVSGLAVTPACMGVLLTGARWFWPVTHFAAAFLIGLMTAFLVCALYGVLMRFVSASRLKGVSLWIQLLSLVAFVAGPLSYMSSSSGPLAGMIRLQYEQNLWSWTPWTSFMQLGMLGCRHTVWQFRWQGLLLIAVATAIIQFGIRSILAVPISEASSMAEGRSWRNPKRTVLSRGYAAAARAVTGSSLGVGVFFFVNKMVRRDWQYRRAILNQSWLPLLLIVAIVMFIANYGPLTLPQSREVSPALMLPHLLGLIIMALCVNLAITNFWTSSWIYSIAPIENLCSFARGVYWGLWVPAVGLPHLVMLAFLAWFWGWREAVLFLGFSLILVSLYLGVEISLIAGVPFSGRPNELRSMLNATYIQVCWFNVAVVPTVVQWELFRNHRRALYSGLVLTVLAWVVVRWGLRELAGEMRWRLYALRMGANQMFKEIE